MEARVAQILNDPFLTHERRVELLRQIQESQPLLQQRRPAPAVMDATMAFRPVPLIAQQDYYYPPEEETCLQCRRCGQLARGCSGDCLTTGINSSCCCCLGCSVVTCFFVLAILFTIVWKVFWAARF